MAKSFIDVVQDSPSMGLGIPVKTKNPLSWTIMQLAGSPLGFKLNEWMVPVSGFKSWTAPPSSVRPRPRTSAFFPVNMLDSFLQLTMASSWGLPYTSWSPEDGRSGGSLFSQRRGSTAEFPCRQLQCVPLLRTSCSTRSYPCHRIGRPVSRNLSTGSIYWPPFSYVSCMPRKYSNDKRKLSSLVL